MTVLESADDRLRANKAVMLAVIQDEGGYALQFAADVLKRDREVVLAAVTRWGPALKYADEGLRADKEVVLAAVGHSSVALKHAAEELKADPDVVALLGKPPEPPAASRE